MDSKHRWSHVKTEHTQQGEHLCHTTCPASQMTRLPHNGTEIRLLL